MFLIICIYYLWQQAAANLVKPFFAQGRPGKCLWDLRLENHTPSFQPNEQYVCSLYIYIYMNNNNNHIYIYII